MQNNAIVFVIDNNYNLIGSSADGNIRRELIKGAKLEQVVDDIIQFNPKFIRKGDKDIKKVIEYRVNHKKEIPILDKGNRIVNVINYSCTAIIIHNAVNNQTS